MWSLTRGFCAQGHNLTRGVETGERTILSMSVQVKVDCEGAGQRSHKPRIVARFQHSQVLGWRRTDELDDDAMYLPDDTPFRHEWAANTPGTRQKITCACGQSVPLTWDKLIPVLDWARDNDEKLSLSLLKKLMQARASV